MKDDLPEPKSVCVACGSFLAECVAPVGESSAALCWPCAHHVVDHGVALCDAMNAECDCPPEKVYPASVIERQRLLGIRAPRAWDELGRRLAPHLPFVREGDAAPRESGNAKHPHGTMKRYWNGCRCGVCRQASAKYQRSRRATN